MGIVVRNLTNVDGRWKYRKVIPATLRPYIDGKITEYVRWLGKGIGKPSPDVLLKYSTAATEYDSLIALAKKRQAGSFDQIGNDTIAHIIASARSEMLEEDDESRFDKSVDVQFHAMKSQLQESGMNFEENLDPSRRWNKRQDEVEDSLSVWRGDYARGNVSDFIIEEAMDRCVSQGLNVDPESEGFQRLGRAYLMLLIETAETILKRQRGEPVPTPTAPSPKPVAQLREAPKQTISGLVEDWWREAKAAGRTISTYESYERSARQMIAFLGHEDANAVTQQDVIRFKDHRLAQGASPKTVKDGDLSGLRALFAWGVGNGRVTTNPAQGVTVMVQKKARGRLKGFTDDEAVAILSHAFQHTQQPREGEEMASAKRWVPWLCAYTGARVGEMVQLRKQDLRQEADTWVLKITPEAVTVKGGEFREVPLHPHLVETGFIDFVRGCDDGFLFMVPADNTDEAKRGAWRTVKNRLSEFVREVVTDPDVQPNHGWRHRMETLARTLDIRRDVTDAITGHTTPGVAADYGDVTIEAKAAAIRKLPRYILKKILG